MYNERNMIDYMSDNNKKENIPYNSKRYLSAYYKVAKSALKYKWCYVVLTFIGIALIGADLLFAQTSRNLFDLAPAVPSNAAIRIIITFTIIIFSQFILRFIESYVWNYFNEAVVYAMRRDILGKIQRLKMEFYDNNHTAKISNTFYNQIGAVNAFVVGDVVNMIRMPLSFIIIGAYLFTVHPYLGITAIVASVLQPVSNIMFKRSLFKAIDDARISSRKVWIVMAEVAQGIREVKINQIEDYYDDKMKQGQRECVRNELTKVKYDTLRMIIKEIPPKIGYIVGITIGILLMVSNRINPGDLIAFITLLNKVAEPFNGITNIYSNFQKSLRSANDLLKLVDEPEENYSAGSNLDLPITSIKFEDVSFGYKTKDTNDDLNTLTNKNNSEDDEEIRIVDFLNNVSFEIKGGSTVALVGPSGSGKSTLIKLLYHFYEPTHGSIMINNNPLKNYNIMSLRNAMSIVSQDIFIFNGTVRDNLVFGRDEVSEEDIKQALIFSESYDFVMKLHEGLDTYIGERGVKLSQGQKQRLSIARSIIKKSNIIILDEPTSALDVETEYTFQQNISKWANGCTKIIIAHRLTTIRDADYILFLDEGKIIEQGSPYDLIKEENSKFKEYWEKQFLFQNENINND